jgi:hypothetical protein
MTALRVSQIEKYGPDEEEQTEKDEKGKDQQGEIIGPDHFLKH